MKEVLKLALNALEWHYSQGHSNTLGGLRLKIDEKALRNLKAALAEPVAANNDEVICPSCCEQFRAIPTNVQGLMLDAGFEPPFTTSTQQQAEPLAWNKQIRDSVDALLEQAGYQPDSSARHQLAMMNFDATPPQPTWQGLTPEEIHQLDPLPHDTFNQQRLDFARAIETKLKDKNNA